MIKRFTALVLAVLLAACGGGTTPDESGPSQPESNPQGDAPSVAGREVGDGVNFCDAYPEPEPVAFDAEPDSARQILPGDRVLGPEEANVVAAYYGDLACETCAAVWESLRTLAEEGRAAVVLRPLPVDAPDSPGYLAAEALEEAAAQGGDQAFYALTDLLFANQETWTERPAEDFVSLVKGYFRDLGLDADAAEVALDAGTHEEAVQATVDDAFERGVGLPPLVLINEISLAPQSLERPDRRSVEYLDALITVAELPLIYNEEAPQVVEEGRAYGAWIVVENKGTIEIDLFADLAPVTVNNFAYLACTGYYDGVPFHRVIPGFVAQAGDPSGLGIGGPGYFIVDEVGRGDLSFDAAGYLSMAKTDQPDSARGQFFITLGPTQTLDEDFTIFGRVRGGITVVSRITPRDPSQPGPLPEADIIERIVVRELE